MKAQIFSNLLSNYLLSFCGLALSFILIPFLIDRLGAQAYGLIVLVESLITLFEILTVSLRVALSRYATFALSQDKMDEFRQVLSTGRLLMAVSATFVFVCGLTVSFFFPRLLNVPPELHRPSQLIFLVIAIGFTVSIPNTVFWSALYAKQRFDLINLSNSIGLILRAVCLFSFYGIAPKKFAFIEAYGWIYLVTVLTQNLLIVLWHRKIFPGVRYKISDVRKEKVREILSYSINTSLGRASHLIDANASTMIINVLWGVTYNAIQAVSLKLPTMMKRVFVEPSWALTSTFTDLVARNDRPKMETLLFLYSKILAVATFPLCFTLAFLARPIIVAWVGTDFLMAGDLLVLYILPLFVHIPFSLSSCIMNAYGKAKVPALIGLVTACSHIFLCILFGHFLSLKLYGIALATATTTLAHLSLFCPFYACRISAISAKRYWTESLLKPLALAAPVVAGSFWLFKIAWPGMSLWVSFGVCAGLSVVYYLGSYFLIFTKQEKKHILEILGLFLGPLKKPWVALTGGGGETE